MVLRQQNIKIPPAVLYSAAGGLAAFATFVFALRSVVIPDPVPACSVRYANATLFSLRGASGKLLSPADIQASLSERDWGLEEHGSIRQVRNAPAKAVLVVALPKGAGNGGTAATPVSGLGFKWRAKFFRKARSACMSYSVWLPQDFKMGVGGVLPGLFGGGPDVAKNAQAKGHFAIPMRWYSQGKVGAHISTTKGTAGMAVYFGDKHFRMPRGRWVAIEQEVILNTPGRSNGVLRLRIDGKLKVKKHGVEFRHKATQRFSGVRADMHYANPRSLKWAPAMKSTKLAITPILVRWR